jgi:hypothetical protein
VIEKLSLPAEIGRSLLRAWRNVRYFARAVDLAESGLVLR